MQDIPKESKLEIGQPCILDFYQCGKLFPCVVAAIKFTDYGKVLYDVSFSPFKEDTELKTTIYNVDSYFVKSEFEDIINNQ